MTKQIGIKLADGTFYPVLEEGLPKRKILDLTTVQDNQTTVMVDLYRSETGTMNDAEYVDTLQISGLIPHPSGEPDLSLSVKIDENDILSAEVIDAESGNHSDTTVKLISRTPAERSEAPDYTLSDIEESAATAADESAFADDAFPAEFEDSIPSDTAHSEITAGTEPADEEFDSVPVPFSADDFDLPDMPSEDTAEEKFSEPVFEPETEPYSGTEEIQTEADITREPEYDTAEPPAETDSTVITETDSDGLDLPPMPDFTEDMPDDPDRTIFSTEDSAVLHEDTLPDFSNFEIPDFDTLHQTEETAHSPLFTDDDFDDPAFHADISSQEPGSAGFDFSGLYTDDFMEKDNNSKPEKKKLSLPVIICIICAAICIGVLAGILLYLPSRLGMQVTKQEETQILVQTPEPAAPPASITALPEKPVQIEPVPAEPEPVPPEPAAPPAEENRIVISDTPAAVPAPPPEPVKEPEPVRYKIKWGDTLWDLAESYYNNPWQYKKIAKANNIRNPDYIISGTYIMIPPK